MGLRAAVARASMLALLMLMVCTLAFARARASGYCQQGGQVVVTSAVPSATRVQQSYPQCSVSVFYSSGAGGFVNTSGTAVTWVSGTPFNANSGWVGLQITINSVAYTIATVNSPTSITLTGSAGTQNGVSYSMPPTAPAAIFSDNSGTVLANPFTSTNTGFWAFYADNRAYDVTVNGGGIPAPFTWGAVQVVEAQNIPTLFSDNLIPSKYSNLQALCSAAASAGQQVTISGAQPIASSFTCNAQVHIIRGGVVKPLLGQVVTFSAVPSCESGIPCFDTSAAGPGSILFSGTTANSIPISWFGALCNSSNDDAPAIKSAIASINISSTNPYGGTVLVGSNSGACMIGSSINVPRGVNLVGMNAVASYIQVLNSASLSSVTPISNSQCGLSCTYAVQQNAIHYEAIRDLTIDGNGVAQVDVYCSQCQELATVEHVVLLNYTKVGLYDDGSSGFSIQNRYINDVYMNPGAAASGSVGIAEVQAISRIHISNVTLATGTNTSGSGISLIDVDGFQVDGCHVEKSTYGVKVTRSSFTSQGRVENCTGNATTLELIYFDSSTGEHSYANIVDNSSPYSVVDATVSASAWGSRSSITTDCTAVSTIQCLATDISAGAKKEQVGGGILISPSQTLSCLIWGADSNDCSTFTLTDTSAMMLKFTSGSTQVFSDAGLTIGNSWTPTLRFGCGVSICSTNDALHAYTGVNIIATETGANNAIAGALIDATGTNIPLQQGLCVTVLLAHTLQAGANTFALNGGAAKSIVSHITLSNIGTAYTHAVSWWSGCYDGAEWQDLSQ